MDTDLTLKYLGTAVELAGLNRFYTRRVLQRCERGEITLLDAAELLMAAVQRGDAELDCAPAGTTNGCAVTRVSRS